MKKPYHETFAGKPTMLGAGLTLLFGLPLAFPNCLFASPTPEFVYVANQVDSTVSAYAVDRSTGALREVAGSPFATGLEPHGVTVDPSGRFVYTANRCFSSNHCARGTVSAYSINSSTGALSPVSGSPFGAGDQPSSVTVDPSGRFAYVTNLNGNTISAYAINSSTGALTRLASSPFAGGGSPFYVTVDPSGLTAYVVNVYANNVSAYKINTATGALSGIVRSPFAAVKYPSSVTVEPSGRFAFVTNECTARNCGKGNVSAYTINSSTGALSPVAGSPFASGTQPFSITVDPSGRFAYVANDCGFHNYCAPGKISAYAINSATGALSEVAGSPFASAKGPDSIAVEPSGRFVYVASDCYYSTGCPPGEVSAFTINSSTGALSEVAGSPFAAGSDPISVAIAAPGH